LFTLSSAAAPKLSIFAEDFRFPQSCAAANDNLDLNHTVQRWNAKFPALSFETYRERHWETEHGSRIRQSSKYADSYNNHYNNQDSYLQTS
jgi:hypothetical protein